MSVRVRLLQVLLLFSSLAGSCSAATFVFEQGVNGYAGTDDTSIYQNRTSNSGGGFSYVYVGVTQDASQRRALIRFDLSSVPAGAIVQSAELRLGVEQSRPSVETHNLHRLTRAWGEGTASSIDPGGFGAAAGTGDATWSSAAHPSTLWTSPGGDFVSTSSASAAVSIAGTTATFASSALAQDVQSWLASPVTNFGWILVGNEAGVHNARRFYSSEGPAGLRPRLTLVLTNISSVTDWSVYN